METHPVFGLLGFVGTGNHYVNERGNTVYKDFLSRDRYLFDDRLCPAGYKPFDTADDAWYFGMWVNPDQLCTVTYCEGDIYVVICPDKDHYNAEIADSIQYYEPGEICRTVGPDGITVYRQDRDLFFIK